MRVPAQKAFSVPLDDLRTSGPPTMGAPGPLTTHCLYNKPELGTAKLPGESQGQMHRQTLKARPQGKMQSRTCGFCSPSPAGLPLVSAK